MQASDEHAPDDEAPSGVRALLTWRWLLFGAALLLTLGVGALGLPLLRFDVSNEALFVEGDPTLERFEALQKTFGSDEVLFLLVEVQDPFQGPDRAQLLALGARLEALDFVESMRSPLHSLVVFDEEGELTSRSVAQELPSGAEVEVWRERVLAYRPFKDLLLSRDATTVAFLLRLDREVMTPQGRKRVAETMQEVLEEEPWGGLRKVCVGTPIITTQIAQILGREMLRSLGGGLALALVLLFALFRSARAAVAPFTLIVVALVVTLSLHGLSGVPLSQLSAILLTLVICVGIADAMHLVAAYERHVVKVGPQAAGLRALNEVWLPCLLTSATTAAGFLALLTSSLAPVRNLGIFAAVGVFAAYGALLCVTPALLVGWVPKTQAGALPSDVVGALLGKLASVVTRRPKTVVGVALLAGLAAAPGIPRLYVDNDLMTDLAPDEPLRQDLEFVHQRLGGTVAAEIVIEPLQTVGDVPPAEVLARAAELEEWLRSCHPEVRAVVGVTSALLEICQAFELPLEIPRREEATGQLLLLLGSSDGDFLAQHVAMDGTSLRISVRMNLIGSREYSKLLDTLLPELERRFEGVARAHVTGGAMLLSQSNDYLLATQRDSFLLALLIVSFLIALSTRELRLGVLSLVPNVLPLVLTLGIMGWLGVAITVPIALIATIAIGIVVDDTIHFVHCLREELRPGVPVDDAIAATFQRAGRAILFTTLLLIGAFALYGFSRLGALQNFGAIACGAFLAAFLADVVVLPALVRLWPAGGE